MMLNGFICMDMARVDPSNANLYGAHTTTFPPLTPMIRRKLRRRACDGVVARA
jgi:hypothetical protein